MAKGPIIPSKLERAPISPIHRPLVIIESPFAGDTERNLKYARAAMSDCLKRGEYPFASHLLYTQAGILNDDDPSERILGIEAGLAWAIHADYTVVYDDLGISKGMELGIADANNCGRQVIYRKLTGWAN